MTFLIKIRDKKKTHTTIVQGKRPPHFRVFSFFFAGCNYPQKPKPFMHEGTAFFNPNTQDEIMMNIAAPVRK